VRTDRERETKDNLHRRTFVTLVTNAHKIGTYFQESTLHIHYDEQLANDG